jgi:hypothetical protein
MSRGGTSPPQLSGLRSASTAQGGHLAMAEARADAEHVRVPHVEVIIWVAAAYEPDTAMQNQHVQEHLIP